MHRSTRYCEELLEIHFARYTVESCPVINFTPLLPIVECSYLTTRCETIIRHKSPTMSSATSPSCTCRVSFLFSLYLFLFTRVLAYVHIRIVRNSRKTRIIIRRTTNIGEAEFIVTSDFVPVIFRRESSSRSPIDELSLCTRYCAIYFDRIFESNSRFRHEQTVLYFYGNSTNLRT